MIMVFCIGMSASCAGNGDDRIYGIVYIPQDVEEQMPAVIYSRGFEGMHHSGMDYAV